MNRKFARSKFVIKTQLGKDDAELIKERAESIIKFANQHDVNVDIGFSNGGELLCDVIVDGLTSSYCKGCVSEVKEMVRRNFNCKIQVILDAY